MNRDPFIQDLELRASARCWIVNAHLLVAGLAIGIQAEHKVLVGTRDACASRVVPDLQSVFGRDLVRRRIFFNPSNGQERDPVNGGGADSVADGDHLSFHGVVRILIFEYIMVYFTFFILEIVSKKINKRTLQFLVIDTIRLFINEYILKCESSIRFAYNYSECGWM